MAFPSNFTFEEMTVSQTAARKSISNKPTGKTLNNLETTAQLMVAVREILGNKPIIVSSGYRSPALNKVIGGVDTSAHTLGWAVDFTCPGFGSPLKIAEHLAKELPKHHIKFDQIIHEYGSWVHISFDPRYREQLLTIDSSGTKTGLH